MKKIKFLNLSIGSEIYRTTCLELPENGDDIQCPACYGQTWLDIYSIIQHGFEMDDIVDIVKCEACGNVYHVQYQVESERYNVVE